MHPYVDYSTIHNRQDMEATQVAIDWWMDKEDVIYILNGILPSHKKWWNLAICDNMDGLLGYYAKWNKSVGESQIPYDLTHKWEIKMTNKHIATEIGLVVTRREEGREEGKRSD